MMSEGVRWKGDGKRGWEGGRVMMSEDKMVGWWGINEEYHNR